MAIVQECLGKPGKIPVTATLWGDVGPVIGLDTNTSQLVSTVSATATGDDGCWTMDLVPNSQIEPTNTTWRIERDDFLTHKKDYITFITVPTTGAPHQAWELQVPTPGPFPLFVGNLEVLSLTINGVLLTTTPLDELPSAVQPIGSDAILPMEQVGIGVKVTADNLVTHTGTLAGHSLNRHRWFEDFDSFGVTVTTDASILVGTKALSQLSGTAAQIAQGQTLGVVGAASMQTGTSTTGRAAVTSTMQAFTLFSTSERYDVGFRVLVPVVSDGTNTYQIRMGFASSMAAVPTDGFYFRSPTAAGNWVAVVRAGNADTSAVDTGIAYDANGAYHEFVVRFIPGTGARFWIDGDIVATVNSGLPSGGANISARGLGIFKSAGATSRTLLCDVFAFDVPHGAVRMEQMP